MGAVFEAAAMGQLSALVAERLGLHFPAERWPDLARNLEKAGEELGFSGPDACARWLAAPWVTTREIETLASHLTVGETYFFRDPASFEVLEHEVLPDLVSRRVETSRTLRLWSAGCCTGEEAYSLAISCLRVLPEPSSWNLSVLATDLNPRSLRKAAEGLYTGWSLRGIPEDALHPYLSPVPKGRFAVTPGVKRLVQFSYLNLVSDTYPSLHNATNAMDVIYCRNVLMYLTPEHQRHVVAALARCLVDGGILAVAPAEAAASLFPMLLREAREKAVFFRKAPQNPGHQETRFELALAACSPSENRELGTGPNGGGFPVPSSLSPVPCSDSGRNPARVNGTGGSPASERHPGAPASAPAERSDPLSLARRDADEGRLAQALEQCRQALATAPADLVAHLLCARIWQELGRLPEAVSEFGKVLYLDQDCILAHHALGSLYGRLGRERDARRHLTVAARLLSARRPDEVLPDSDGLTCGRLAESVRATQGM